MNVERLGERVVRRLSAALRRVRDRAGWVDHLVRAAIRYDHADGGRLAAAVTYYAFFATFSLALLGFSLIGYVVRSPAVLSAMQDQLPGGLPRLDAQTVRHARGPAALIGFVVWPISGVFWVDALRSSMRAVWGLPQYPGTFLRRQLVNLMALAGLGVLLAVSLGLAAGVQNALGWLLFDVAATGPYGRFGLGVAGFVLGLMTNTILAAAVLSGLPQLRMRLRRLLGPAVLVTAGVQILTTVGRFYVNATQSNPAYHLVAGAVGLLVFLNVLNQLILFAAALAATASAGRTIDLAQHSSASPRMVYLRRARARRVHRTTLPIASDTVGTRTSTRR